jgi:hypothetical protein
MQKVLKEIIDLVSALRIHMRTRVSPQDIPTQIYLQKLYHSATRFAALARKNKKDEFIDDHIGMIYRIYDTLVGDFAHIHGGVSQNMRSICDTIMNALGIKKPLQKFASVPSVFLSQLLRGITYFESDTEVEYHRKQSCGSKTKTYLQKFQIEAGDSGAIAEEKKAALQKCYIERKAFDKIHQHILHRQNIGHLRELRAIEQLWQKYYPDQEIIVEVGYDEFNVPDVMSISYQIGRNTRTEDLYVKQGDVVDCTRKVYKLTKRFSPFLIETHSKQQTFAKEQPWKKPSWRSI